jgi:hypothetical protein
MKMLTGHIKCSNPSCKYHDMSLSYHPSMGPSETARHQARLRGTFNPGANAITVSYRNFRGEDVGYVGDKTTIRFTKHHLSLCVRPTGKRIVFAKRFIRNISDLEPLGVAESAVVSGPTAVERQILGYHQKYGTTSARYEDTRRKHPSWNRKTAQGGHG